MRPTTAFVASYTWLRIAFGGSIWPSAPRRRRSRRRSSTWWRPHGACERVPACCGASWGSGWAMGGWTRQRPAAAAVTRRCVVRLPRLAKPRPWTRTTSLTRTTIRRKSETGGHAPGRARSEVVPDPEVARRVRTSRVLGSVTVIAVVVLALALTPSAAYAWTPGTHVFLGEAVMRSLDLLPSGVSDLLRTFPYEFLYGSIAADTSIAKKYAPVGRHCHSWTVGFEIFDRASDEALRSFGMGYLAHLAADTVA